MTHMTSKREGDMCPSSEFSDPLCSSIEPDFDIYFESERERRMEKIEEEDAENAN